MKKNKQTSKYNSALGEIIDKYSYVNRDAFKLSLKFNIDDMYFRLQYDLKGYIFCLLIGIQVLIILLSGIAMCLPDNIQSVINKLCPTILVWLILIAVELVIVKFKKLNKSVKLQLSDINDAIDILNKNGDRNIIELIPVGYGDRNNIELCLGDIIYNKAEDNYWIIKKPSDTTKKQYDIDKDIKYVLVLANDYSKGILYLDDKNENLEMHYRIGDDAYESSFIALLGGTDDDVLKVITKRD